MEGLQEAKGTNRTIRNWKHFAYDTTFDRIFNEKNASIDIPPRRQGVVPNYDEFHVVTSDREEKHVMDALQPTPARRRSSRIANRGFSSRRRRRKPVKHFLNYPNEDNAKDVVTLNTGDVERLEEGVFFNDNLIDFYTRYMRKEVWSDEVKSKIHVFSCHFYEKLIEKSEHFDSKTKINYENVRTWTKDFNIFQKDYVIIPINGCTHWSLVIVHFKYAEMERENLKKKEKKKQSKTKERKSDDDDDDDMEIVAFTETEKKMELLKGTRNFVLHMDSLKLHNSSRIVKRLRTYFNMEWNRVYGTIEKESDESVKDDEEKE